MLGLAALATGAAAAVLGSRRRHLAADRLAVEPDGPGGGAISSTGAEAAASVVTQTWISGPAGTLYVRDSGEVEGGRLPVVFVHGMAGNGGQWSQQVAHLHRLRRALALDLRGHGESDPAEDSRYDVPAMTQDVGAVAHHFALRRFILVGHSFGALVAMAYAARHPERVAGLLLADPNGDQTLIPRDQIAPFLDGLRADPHRELETYFRQLVLGGDKDAARWVLEDVRLTDENAIVGAVTGSVEFSPLPALAAYTGPKLAVISDMNSLPYSLHNLLPELRAELLRGTGHWLMMDRPEPFNRLLDAFIAQVESA